MRHPTEGVLRRLLDEPAGVADSDREHVATCSRCLGELAAMRADAVLVDAALATEGGADADVAAGWQRLSAAAPATGRVRSSRPGRSRAVLRRPVVAAVAVALALSGGAAAAANDWLQIFQTEQIAPITFTASDLMAVPDLSAYGKVELTDEADVHQVPDAAAAAAESGLDVPVVNTLPRGVSGEPVYQVGDEMSATFTFSADRARQAADDMGETLPPPPPGLDGSQVRLVAGPGVLATWSQSGDMPVLVVGRAVAPKAFSDGVPFETVRDYLLALPGLPEDVAAKLRTFSADGATLPLPVPADRFTTSSADVNGAPATVLATHDRTMAAVVWVDDGVVTAVAGALDTDEVLSVARDLR